MDSAHRVPITDFIPLFFPIAAEQAQDPTADVKATPYWPQPAPCAFDEEMKEVCWEQSESTMHRIFVSTTVPRYPPLYSLLRVRIGGIGQCVTISPKFHGGHFQG